MMERDYGTHVARIRHRFGDNYYTINVPIYQWDYPCCKQTVYREAPLIPPYDCPWCGMPNTPVDNPITLTFTRDEAKLLLKTCAIASDAWVRIAEFKDATNFGGFTHPDTMKQEASDLEALAARIAVELETQDKG